jgi:integral membrane protein
VEGVSALILLFVAMPLKYVPPADSPAAALGAQVVFWVGAIHGALFVAYALITFVAWGKGALTANLVGLAALASIVPFGPFFIDKKLKAHDERSKPPRTTCLPPHMPRYRRRIRSFIVASR